MFAASLDSLTSDGGFICLLDVCVEKIFGIGYVDEAKKGSSDIWNEQEEGERQDAWNVSHPRVLSLRCAVD